MPPTGKKDVMRRIRSVSGRHRVVFAALSVTLALACAGDAADAPDVRATGELGLAAAQRGESIYNSNCNACHSTGSDTRVGPGHAGVFQRAAGRTGLSAEEYLRQSIIDPSAFVVDGFAPVMPATFGSSLTDREIDDLIAYLRTL
ncbi:MAG: c-type cytochrome [Dehalococcoidia bacterium]|nr:c-type cytochrome [Dehalococcoidia bacterium]